LTANWIDLVLILIVVLGVAIGLKRGFGKAIFDFAALLVALRLAEMAYLPLSKSIHFSADKQANLAWSYGLSFVVIGAVLWFIGKAAYDTTLISLETFDPALGAMLGFGIAVIVGHALAKTAFIATAKLDYSELIAHSRLAAEFYGFGTYHSVVETMKRLGD